MPYDADRSAMYPAEKSLRFHLAQVPSDSHVRDLQILAKLADSHTLMLF